MLYSTILSHPDEAWRGVCPAPSTRQGRFNERVMPLTTTDWVVIVGYLLINLLIGIYYGRRASGNTAEFFISGRDVSWWLAGTSMVATTFAADTPLLVTGLVATQGIAGNWLWWNQCLTGMLTVFFFARYWRRAEIMTDVELTELRYSVKPAGPDADPLAFLPGCRRVRPGHLLSTRPLTSFVPFSGLEWWSRCHRAVDRGGGVYHSQTISPAKNKKNSPKKHFLRHRRKK